MRLADQILQDKTPWYAEFRRVLAGAVPFEIDADVGRMAHAVARSDAKKLVAAQSFCRIPFAKTWVEWVGPSALMGPGWVDDASPQRPVPHRSGFLCIAATDSMAMGWVFFAWGHKEYGVTISPICPVFDWQEEISDFDETFRRFDDKMALRGLEQFHSASDADLERLSRRCGVAMNPLLMDLLDAIKAKGEAQFKQWFSQAAADISGEAGFVEAVLAVMNSRNLAAISEPADMSKINRARAKMRRSPLLSFRSVKISLSKSNTRRARNEGHGTMPLHIVRGHFKVRKSGIYWWSPFWRGDAAAGVVSRKGYEVAA